MKIYEEEEKMWHSRDQVRSGCCRGTPTPLSFTELLMDVGGIAENMMYTLQDGEVLIQGLKIF